MILTALVVGAAVVAAGTVYVHNSKKPAAVKIAAAQDKINAVATSEGKKIETAVATELKTIGHTLAAAIKRAEALHGTGAVPPAQAAHLTDAVAHLDNAADATFNAKLAA